MSYKHNHFTDNNNDAPSSQAGASEQDEPIVHNRAILTSGGKNKPFYLRGFFILCVFSLICFALFFIYRLNANFSEWFVRYISGPLRMFLSFICSVFPFSVAESIILFLPIAIIAFYIKIWSDSKKDQSDITFKKYLKIIVCFIMVLLDLFFITVAPSYQRLPLSQNLGIQCRQVTAQRLENTSRIMVEMLNRDASDIYYANNGMSYSKENFSELSREILDCYDKFCQKYDFVFPVGFNAKPVALSKPLTYLHVSGVYTYFTGEANINVNYPDYILPHTVAHEMAHARGIFNEGDANFIAFLVCLESDNPYIRYSGLMNIFPYVTDALYIHNPQAYTDVISQLNYNVFEEYDAFADFFEEYSVSKAADISSTVNDAFLKANGQEQGINSYSLVVDLSVNYLEEYYEKDMAF